MTQILVKVFFVLISFGICRGTKRPHIIFVVADDLGWGDVSFHGSKQIPTPNIDALAASGLILNQYYVSPICSPSRSAIMAARYPIHTGLQHGVISAPGPWGLPLNFKLLPQYFKDLGYDTHAVGKWHLGFLKKEYTPTFRGFDSHFGYWTSNEDYFDHTKSEDYTFEGKRRVGWGLDFHDGLKPVRNETGRYAADIFTEKAINILQGHNKTKPLFLYLAHLSVHVGNTYKLLQAPQEYIDRFPNIKDKRRRTFAGMVSALDDAIGRLFKSLHDTGYLDNCIFILTTDNGGAAGGVDNSEGCNWPLRGTKYTHWEGGVRGTALIWSPLMPRKGVAEQMMHVSDWLPTLYSAAGGDMSDLDTDMDGLNIWPSLRDNQPSQRKEILHNIDPIWNMSAVRVGNYKLIQGTYPNGNFDSWYRPPGVELNDKTFRKVDHREYSSNEYVPKVLREMGLMSSVPSSDVIVQCGPRPANASTNCKPLKAPCLYNIAEDPCEFNNIAGQNPQIVQQLLQKLKDYNSTAVPPLNKPGVREADPQFHGYEWTTYMDDTSQSKIN